MTRSSSLTAALLIGLVATGAGARPRVDAPIAGAEGNVRVDPLPPTGTPTEAPVCPDCESKGFVQLVASGDALVALRFKDSLVSARTKLSKWAALLPPGSSHLRIYQDATRQVSLVDLPLSGFANTAWQDGDGKVFSAKDVTASELGTAVLDVRKWGYDKATGQGYVVEIELDRTATGGLIVRLPLPVRQVDGSLRTAP